LWPETELDEMVERYKLQKHAVVGAGRCEGNGFILQAREKDLVDDWPPVPLFYSFHLEHLCYLTRYYYLAWGWMIRSFLVDDSFDEDYILAVEVIGRTWIYHQNALSMVEVEIRDKGPLLFVEGERIGSLDEWVVRQRHDLVMAEQIELDDARKNGYFDKDILYDADYFSM